MHSQLYFSGRLVSGPAIASTRKGAPWTRLLMETELVKSDGRGGLAQETIIVPVNCFGHQAEAVRDLREGDALTIGARLHGTKFEGEGGTKYGVQLVADAVYVDSRERHAAPKNMEEIL